VLFAGHGEGTFGPLGPTVGKQPVTWFDQLPLRASAWGVCMACSTGDSSRVEDVVWDHDDPGGAAEHLLLAGCRYAADCLTPVPEVHAALLLEEFGVRAAEGEDAEIAFATAVQGWRTFWSALADPLADQFAKDASLDASTLSSWLVDQLDGERRRRLGRDVRGLPRDGLFASLGTHAHSSSSPNERRAHEIASQVLAPFVESTMWAAFRWMARR
jgi:hypothetical protein